MIKKASFLALVSCAVFSASCYAGQYAQALGDCVSVSYTHLTLPTIA